MKTQLLRPADVAVAIQLCLSTDVRIKSIAARLGRSAGEVHNAIRRLTAARLVDWPSRAVFRGPLLRFIECGVPHAYPVRAGSAAIGTATAWVPDEANRMHGPPPGDVEFVWPDARGSHTGQALSPLCPLGTEAASNNVGLWTALSLTDLIRLGGAREARQAMSELERLIGAAERAPA